MAKSLREGWKHAKARAAKDLDMKKVADNEKFGPKLDTFEAELKAYHELMKKLATRPAGATEEAAAKKVQDAALAATRAAAAYMVALKNVEDHSNGTTKTAAASLRSLLVMEIYAQLRKASQGDFGV